MAMIKLFFAAFFCFLFIDLIWLGLIAKNIYFDQLGAFLRQDVIWPSAILVYVALSLGLVLFVLPRVNAGLLSAFLWGAVFGAVVYGVYDFTNYALVANWPLKITLIDFCWGMVLCGLTSTLVSWFKPSLM